MAKDYYATLGVPKTASADEIKKAFYKLAAQHHPDKPTGDEAKFKQINEAYQTLSDADKRAHYDRFGSDGPQFGGGGAGAGFGGFDFSGFQQGGFDFSQFSGGGNIDLNDIMSELFGSGSRRNPRGRNVEVRAHLTFKESIFGADKTIEVPHYEDGKQIGKRTISVHIPAGIDNGMTLEMRGEGEKMHNGRHGNLHIRVSVEQHKVFRKEGRNLVMEKEIKLTEAILGGSFEVEMLDGKEITVTIPAGIQMGAILRVKSKGVPNGSHSGDLLVVTSIHIPKKLSKEAKKALETLKQEGV